MNRFRYAILTAFWAIALFGCDPPDGPQVDDDQLRQEILEQYRAIADERAEHGLEVAATIDSAREEVDAAVEAAEDISPEVFELSE